MLCKCGAVLTNQSVVCPECRATTYERVMRDIEIVDTVDDGIDTEAYELFLSEG